MFWGCQTGEISIIVNCIRLLEHQHATRWWSQIFLFSSLLGKDSHFDWLINVFEIGLKPPTRLYSQVMMTDAFYEHDGLRVCHDLLPGYSRKCRAVSGITGMTRMKSQHTQMDIMDPASQNHCLFLWIWTNPACVCFVSKACFNKARGNIMFIQEV